MYTPGLGKSSLLNWQSRARGNLGISPIKTYLRLLDPSTLNVQFLPMHNRPRFTLEGYQTSSEMKSSNVLYFKVIYKPFQPKLEVTAVSTIMTLTSDNFSSDFSSYISKKRLLGELIFKIYHSFPMSSMLYLTHIRFKLRRVIIAPKSSVLVRTY